MSGARCDIPWNFAHAQLSPDLEFFQRNAFGGLATCSRILKITWINEAVFQLLWARAPISINCQALLSAVGVNRHHRKGPDRNERTAPVRRRNTSG
jgi:hypothetical protein